jgi:hypothetical protein
MSFPTAERIYDDKLTVLKKAVKALITERLRKPDEAYILAFANDTRKGASTGHRQGEPRQRIAPTEPRRMGGASATRHTSMTQ